MKSFEEIGRAFNEMRDDIREMRSLLEDLNGKIATLTAAEPTAHSREKESEPPSEPEVSDDVIAGLGDVPEKTTAVERPESLDEFDLDSLLSGSGSPSAAEQTPEENISVVEPDELSEVAAEDKGLEKISLAQVPSDEELMSLLETFSDQSESMGTSKPAPSSGPQPASAPAQRDSGDKFDLSVEDFDKIVGDK